MPEDDLSQDVMSVENDADAEAFEVASFQRNRELGRNLRRRAYSVIDTVERKMRCNLPKQDREKTLEVQKRFEGGDFFLDRTGNDLGLDPEMSAVLMYLRDDLLAQLPDPKVQDIIVVDVIVASYRQMLRLSSWIENQSVILERDMFMDEGLAELHGAEKADQIEQRFALLETKLNRMLNQVARRMYEALDRLQIATKPLPKNAIIRTAAQVNIGSQVQNNASPTACESE